MPRFGDSVRKALSGQQVTYEYQMQRQGGSLRAHTLVPEINVEGEISASSSSRTTSPSKSACRPPRQAQRWGHRPADRRPGHDFNNLLTVVIGNLAALRDHRRMTPSSTIRRTGLAIARRGITQLIRRLLTFSRQQPLEPQVVDIGQLIANLSVGSPLAARSISVLPDPARPAPCPGRPASWKAPCSTLPSMRDAMPGGGRPPYRCPRRRPVRATPAPSNHPGQYVLIEVSDNGSGMDAATLARLRTFHH